MDNNKPKQPNKPPKKEQLTRRELEELMNLHIPTYKRVNGAWRRR